MLRTVTLLLLMLILLAGRAFTADAPRSSRSRRSGTRTAQRFHRPRPLADRWYCTFREAEGHVGGDGKRVLESTDGKGVDRSRLSEDGIDLRDPKMSVTPDDRLMIVAGSVSRARCCWAGSHA
jgi:hypothetical protein